MAGKDVELYQDAAGRYRVKGAGRYASAAEKAAHGVGVQATQNGGPGNDRQSVHVHVDGAASAPRRTAGGGGSPGASVSLLRSEVVTRLRIEDAADLLFGLLSGALARAQAPQASTVQAEAAAYWARAHPAGAGNRDAKQVEAGRQMAEALGLVAVHMGWTPETWQAAMPPELAAVDGGGILDGLLGAIDEHGGIIGDVAVAAARGLGLDSAPSLAQGAGQLALLASGVR